MKINYLYCAFILLSLSLFAHSEPLNDFITNLEKKHSEAIKGFSTSITEQIQSLNPKYEKYGGELGNKYFQYYGKQIMTPALSEYFNSLKKDWGDKQNDENKLFVDMVNTLGHFRQKVAISTRSKDANLFGQKTNTLEETIADGNKDPTYQSWFEHLQLHFDIGANNFSRVSNLNDIFDNIADSIYKRGNKNIITSNEKTFLAVDNPTNVQIGSYHIEPDINGEVTPNIKIYNKNNIKFTFLHAVALYNNLSKLFFATLDPKLSQDQLLEAIGRFFFYWSQAAIYTKGQASVGEWIIQGIAQSWSYNLVFSPSWLGKENGSMAPNMHATSYLDEKEFMDQFLANASLQKRS